MFSAIDALCYHDRWGLVWDFHNSCGQKYNVSNVHLKKICLSCLLMDLALLIFKEEIHFSVRFGNLRKSVSLQAVQPLQPSVYEMHTTDYCFSLCVFWGASILQRPMSLGSFCSQETEVFVPLFCAADTKTM